MQHLTPELLVANISLQIHPNADRCPVRSLFNAVSAQLQQQILDTNVIELDQEKYPDGYESLEDQLSATHEVLALLTTSMLDTLTEIQYQRSVERNTLRVSSVVRPITDSLTATVLAA